MRDPTRSRYRLLPSRVSAWLARWGPILPLLIAEAIVWAGFGALLPIMPLYFTEHGTELPMLGAIIAAWPAVRLVSEPGFGWLADRVPRIPLMVGGLVVTGVATVLPLVFVGPFAFLVLRGISGLGAAAYDPAARGLLVDTTGRDRQGEVFGLYSAAQFGGFTLGPAVGGFAAAATGDPTIVFWVAGIGTLVSALLVALRIRDARDARGGRGAPRATSEALDTDAAATDAGASAAPLPLLNRILVAALVLNVGSYFAGGSYEVVWSLYLTSLGGGLDVIGLTFAAFGVPVLLLSPLAGRLIDRRGGHGFLVIGMVTIAVTGFLYPLVAEVWWVFVLSLVEGSAFALVAPALYSLVARASPPGRSSTAQGLFGAAGTVGTIVAALTAGSLAAIDLRLPFVATGIAILAALAIGSIVGGRPVPAAMRPRPNP